MKKFRMMLPILAVIFAVAGAIGGDFLPIEDGYYQVGAGCSSTTLPVNEEDCFVSTDDELPICTVNANGPKSAYADAGCADILRHQ